MGPILNPCYWFLFFILITIAGLAASAAGLVTFSIGKKNNPENKRATRGILVGIGTFFLVICGFCGYEIYREEYDFYGYAGLGDWIRIPLQYPYELRGDIGFEYVSLGVWKEDNNIVDHVRKYTVRGSILVGEVGPKRWFSFNMDSGKLVYYSTEDELNAAWAEFGFDGKPELASFKISLEEILEKED